MPDKYRQITCPYCEQKLRLTVKKRSLGGKIEVTCGKCQKKFEITTSLSKEVDESEMLQSQAFLEEFAKTLNEAVTTSPLLDDLIEKIHQAGYHPFLIMEATLSLHKHGHAERDVSELTPLVKNGEVVPGLFNADDKKWMKGLKVNLDGKK